MRPILLISLLCLGGCGFFAKPGFEFDQMRGTLTEAEAMKLQPSLDWQCSANEWMTSHYGQRVCDGLAKELDGIPAARVDYMFRDGTLSFAIIEINPDGYAALEKLMDAQHKRHDPASPGMGGGRYGKLTGWDVQDGVVVSSASEKKPNGNVIVMWTSNKEVGLRRSD